MQLDISLVLFRPEWVEVGETLSSLASVADEFGTLWILLSGSNADYGALSLALAEAGLTANSVVEHRWDNLGFASGHNRLLANAFNARADYCLVMNPDIRIESGALTRLVVAAAPFAKSSLVAPTLQSLVAESTTDSLGVRWTANGRHIDDGLGSPWAIDVGTVRDSLGVSGACMLVSAGVFRRLVEATGCFFDDYFLAYREDAELGIRARTWGVASKIVSMQGFHHSRHVRGFKRGSALPDALGVRNRFLLRWKLGRSRPGLWGLPTSRDLLVVLSTILVEKSSRAALKSAFRVRRAVRDRSKSLGPEAGRTWPSRRNGEPRGR